MSYLFVVEEALNCSYRFIILLRKILIKYRYIFLWFFALELDLSIVCHHLSIVIVSWVGNSQGLKGFCYGVNKCYNFNFYNIL